jgi:hypothetical protein
MMPLPISNADLRDLKKDLQTHASDVELVLCHMDTGEPFLIVTVDDPRIAEDSSWQIIRRERGWQVFWCGGCGAGSSYEFASTQEVALFFVPRVGHRFGGR